MVTKKKRAAKPAKAKKPEKPLVQLATAKAFRAWLAKHHESSDGIWLQLAKKGSELSSPTYAEALDVALCFGWIDGQKGAIDAHSWKQMFTRRGPRSIWSKINREHVARLIASGEMTKHGLAEVEKARANGQWERAYDSPKNATLAEDFQTALAANPQAKAFFATLNAANRYAISFRIQNAKKPETRLRKVSELVAMLARGERLH
ncbi:MAG: YdeI/OmpD-associated family protein [Polyangiaceae bacterium]